ncbi:hypothetical protein, partial [Mammaliicoccus vitulinus]
MKVLKNSIISSLLLSSMVLGVSYGNDSLASETSHTKIEDTSPKITEEQSDQIVENKQDSKKETST